MAQRAAQPASYADLQALPPHTTGEILFGTLHAHPRPAPKHAQAASALGEELGPPFKRGRGGPGGWMILDEPELHLGSHVVVPDLSGWRRARMPELPVDRAWIELAPDWVCEVLSPRTAAIDRGAKLLVYAEHEVAHVWLVDPEACTLEILERDPRGYRIVAVFSGESPVRAIPFDAIELDLAALWAR